jgi:hypothetical protein
LTPREAARLQGFPEDYKLSQSDSQAYKQFGNSVAVPVVNAIAKQMLKTLKTLRVEHALHREIDVEKIRKVKVKAALKGLKSAKKTRRSQQS